MESEIVTINQVPIKVDSWGGYLPSKVLNKFQEKPAELILVVPGNPGVTKFYERFLSNLYEKTRKPIWIISHGGHLKIKKKSPSVKRNNHLYNLQGQVDQKLKFIQTYLDGVKLYCIGHSIGSKMLSEIMLKENKVEIEKCIMLFPTLERMADTPNGRNLIFVLKYILWLTLLGSWIFAHLPKFLKLILLKSYCWITKIPPNNIPAIIELIDPHVLNKVFFLADDEMKHVKELNDEFFKLHGHKLKLYYGASDGWTPLNFYAELKDKHKNVDAEVCSKGYQHTFVLGQSKEVSELVLSWLKF